MENIINLVSDAQKFFQEYPDEQDYYVTFRIPKRSGWRIIDAPSAELKELQRRFYTYLLDANRYFKIDLWHHTSHGFVKNKSICTNALSHANDIKMLESKMRLVLIKMDIAKAFPSVGRYKLKLLLNYLYDIVISIDSRYIKYTQKYKNYNVPVKEELLDTLYKLISFKDRLPQGSPCSPVLLNILLANFHKKMSTLARTILPTSYSHVSYTNYADDLTLMFHLPDTKDENGKHKYMIDKNEIVTKTNTLLQGYGFFINKDKTKLFTIKRGFRITGVSVYKLGDIGINRKKRSNIRARINNFIFKIAANGAKLDSNLQAEKQVIQGLIAHQRCLEHNLKDSKLDAYIFKRIEKAAEYFKLSQDDTKVLIKLTIDFLSKYEKQHQFKQCNNGTISNNERLCDSSHTY